MRIRSIFTHTLREPPSSASLVSHQLLTRAGYFQEIGKGGFAELPLGLRALQKIGDAFLKRTALETTRIHIPLVLAFEGGLPDTDSISFADNQGRQLQLVSSFQYAFQEVARQHLYSYRQLPASVYYSGPRWTDEVHPGSGLFYSRLPHGMELSAFFSSAEEQQQVYQALTAVINSFLEAAGIPNTLTPMPSDADDSGPREWYYGHPAGRTMLFHCPACGYTASSDQVRFSRKPDWHEDPLPLEKVETPDCKTIEDLARFLNIPKQRTAKAVFLTSGQSGKPLLIIAVIPGNRELDEKRLSRAMQAKSLRPAAESEILAAGAVPGYGSPINTKNAFVAVDAQIPLNHNLVAGANVPGYHFLNVNMGRDYNADLVAEITKPLPEDLCPVCEAEMQVEPAVRIAELGNSEIEHSVMDKEGKISRLSSLSCTLHLTRMLAAVAETSHDPHGLVMPMEMAPFPVHVVLLPDKEGLVREQAVEIVQQIEESGFETLYDDRQERAGVKFNDADLIGIPCRITISQRALAEGNVEVKLRGADSPTQIPLQEITGFLTDLHKEM